MWPHTMMFKWLLLKCNDNGCHTQIQYTFQYKCKTPWINLTKKKIHFPMEVYIEGTMDAIIIIDGTQG